MAQVSARIRREHHGDQPPSRRSSRPIQFDVRWAPFNGIPCGMSLDTSARSPRVQTETVEMRRKLHQCPEMGNDLRSPVNWCSSRSKGYRSTSRCMKHLGIAALLTAASPARRYCYSGDMDALPLQRRHRCRLHVENRRAHARLRARHAHGHVVVGGQAVIGTPSRHRRPRVVHVSARRRGPSRSEIHVGRRPAQCASARGRHAVAGDRRVALHIISSLPSGMVATKGGACHGVGRYVRHPCPRCRWPCQHAASGDRSGADCL